MTRQELDHALQLVVCLLDENQDEKTRRDLSELSEILTSARSKADTSITFDSFAGTIEDEEQCSGYLQVRSDHSGRLSNFVKFNPPYVFVYRNWKTV